MVAFSTMATSKFLKKEDLDENGNLVHIKAFKRVNVAQEGEPDEMKFTVQFNEFEKPLVLNATNRAILEKTYGPDTDDCLGNPIVIYNDPNVSYAGKLIGGIRMRAPKGHKQAPAQAPAKPKPQNNPDDFDDSVPF